VLGPIVAVASLCAIITVFSSRLVLCQGQLVAVGVWRVKSVPVNAIARIEASPWPWGGIVVTLNDGSTLRTLVTGDVSGGGRRDARIYSVLEHARATVRAQVSMAARHEQHNDCSLTHGRKSIRPLVFASVAAGGLASIGIAREIALAAGSDWAMHRHPGVPPTYAMVAGLAYLFSIGLVAALRTSD
jgi:hypothetical protein